MTKEGQRKIDSTFIQYECRVVADDARRGKVFDAGFFLLSDILLNCTKIISNRLIELDETLERAYELNRSIVREKAGWE